MYWARDKKGVVETGRVTQFNDQPDPEHWKIARSQAAIMSRTSSRFSDRCLLVFKNEHEVVFAFVSGLTFARWQIK